MAELNHALALEKNYSKMYDTFQALVFNTTLF